MELDSNLLAEGVDDILTSVFRGAGEVVYIINPTADALETLVDVATSMGESLPTVRVVADESTLKGVLDDFIVASNAANLVDTGLLSLRTADVDEENSLLITHAGVFALVTAGDRVAALMTDDATFVDTAVETYHGRWADADEYKLRTPPLSRVRETLEAEIGPAVRDDFDAVLGALSSARGDGDGLDEVTISLLVAARNDVLLYDISKWGEDVGIASKATFSRTKTRLEEMGLIDTEKVPIDVGRPRLRLKLGDERLAGASSDALAEVAQQLLAE